MVAFRSTETSSRPRITLGRSNSLRWRAAQRDRVSLWESNCWNIQGIALEGYAPISHRPNPRANQLLIPIQPFHFRRLNKLRITKVEWTHLNCRDSFRFSANNQTQSMPSLKRRMQQINPSFTQSTAEELLNSIPNKILICPANLSAKTSKPTSLTTCRQVAGESKVALEILS